MLKVPASRCSLTGAVVALTAAALIGCGGGGGGGGSSTNGTAGTTSSAGSNSGSTGGTFNDTAWIASEGWSGSNALTFDGSTANWVAKGVRDNPTNIVQVRARIPADLRTIPGEVYIVLPASATNGQVFTRTSSANATTGTRVQFFDYSRFATGGSQIEYNAATQGSYTITVNSITATHVNVTYSATLYRASNETTGTARHTTSGTIDVDTTSG